MRIHVLAFGRLRIPGLRESADYYLRNLAPWAEVTETELKAFALPDKSAASRELALRKDEETFLTRAEKLLEVRARLILLDERGKAQPTTAWAEQFRRFEDESVSQVVIGIGSSMGWSPTLKSRAHALVSLGPQTVSHELARVVLAEQMYRAFSVIRGHPYHHEG